MRKKFIISLIFIMSCSGTSPITDNTESSVDSSTSSSTIPIEEQLLIKNKIDGKKGVVRIVTKGIKIEESNDNQLVKTQGDSSGSGFFISTDGFVVTNNHVIGGAVTVDVYIGEERSSYKAKIVGTSECDDIAVLKINLPIGGAFYFEFDDINPVLGQDILAIGFPRGDEQITYLNGIVSKEKAEGSNQWSSIDYAFEHTAEILPGSSGGPIINEFGKVVGVAYAGNSDRQEFGIPSTVVRSTINGILDNTFNKSLGANAEQFLDFGMYIYSAEPNSPFDKAGFNGGELITHINGLDISKESTMDVYCSALQTRGESSAINFKGYDIDEKSDFEASVSLDGSKATFKLTNTTTTTKPTTTTTKPKATTTTTLIPNKPSFSSEELNYWLNSQDDNTNYKRWRQDKIIVGIYGEYSGFSEATLRNYVLPDLTRLTGIEYLLEIEPETADTKIYFGDQSNWKNFYDSCDTTNVFSSNWIWSTTDRITRTIACIIPSYYYSRQGFPWQGLSNNEEATTCHAHHLRRILSTSAIFSIKGANSDIYGHNHIISNGYCDETSSFSPLDEAAIKIHYSNYVYNAKTKSEVYNLLK